MKEITEMATAVVSNQKIMIALFASIPDLPDDPEAKGCPDLTMFKQAFTMLRSTNEHELVECLAQVSVWLTNEGKPRLLAWVDNGFCIEPAWLELKAAIRAATDDPTDTEQEQRLLALSARAILARPKQLDAFLLTVDTWLTAADKPRLMAWFRSLYHEVEYIQASEVMT